MEKVSKLFYFSSSTSPLSTYTHTHRFLSFARVLGTTICSFSRHVRVGMTMCFLFSSLPSFAFARVSYTDRAANSVDQQLDGSVQSGPGNNNMPVPAAVAATGTPPIAYMAQPPYPIHQGMMQPMMAAMPPPPPGKPGEPAPYAYPPTGHQIVYLVPTPMQGQEGEPVGYPAMFPLAMPFPAAGYSPYAMVAPRPDGQMGQMVIAAPPPPSAYGYGPMPPHPQPMYAPPPPPPPPPKPTSRESTNEMAAAAAAAAAAAQAMDQNARRGDMRMGDGMAGGGPGGPHNGK